MQLKYKNLTNSPNNFFECSFVSIQCNFHLSIFFFFLMCWIWLCYTCSDFIRGTGGIHNSRFLFLFRMLSTKILLPSNKPPALNEFSCLCGLSQLPCQTVLFDLGCLFCGNWANLTPVGQCCFLIIIRSRWRIIHSNPSIALMFSLCFSLCPSVLCVFVSRKGFFHFTTLSLPFSSLHHCNPVISLLLSRHRVCTFSISP